MSKFTVDSDLLAAAALVIGAASTDAGEGWNGVWQARRNFEYFGDEQILDAFLNMCVRAEQALEEIQHTTGVLAANVAACGVGYLNTDKGVVTTSGLNDWGGFSP